MNADNATSNNAQDKTLARMPNSFEVANRVRCFKEFGLKSRILSRDVVTRWNSTYYMLSFAIKYRAAIDAMTADKSLKLRKFELETEEWAIAEDLVSVLLVRACLNY